MTSMNTKTAAVTAHTYTLIGRLDHEPTATPTDETTRAAALYSALRGVDLGRYDHHVIGTLAGMGDLTIRTLVSLIERARTATPTDASHRDLETWCREQSGATGTPLAVLLALCSYADDDGANACPSTDELAAKTGRSSRTVTHAIRRLTETGTITRQIMAGHDGRNKYTINQKPAS
jgi:hypothetical protein